MGMLSAANLRNFSQVQKDIPNFFDKSLLSQENEKKSKTLVTLHQNKVIWSYFEAGMFCSLR